MCHVCTTSVHAHTSRAQCIPCTQEHAVALAQASGLLDSSPSEKQDIPVSRRTSEAWTHASWLTPAFAHGRGVREVSLPLGIPPKRASAMSGDADACSLLPLLLPRFCSKKIPRWYFKSSEEFHQKEPYKHTGTCCFTSISTLIQSYPKKPHMFPTQETRTRTLT